VGFTPQTPSPRAAAQVGQKSATSENLFESATCPWNKLHTGCRLNGWPGHVTDFLRCAQPDRAQALQTRVGAPDGSSVKAQRNHPGAYHPQPVTATMGHALDPSHRSSA